MMEESIDAIKVSFSRSKKNFVLSLYNDSGTREYVFSPSQFNDFLQKSIMLVNTVVQENFQSALSDLFGEEGFCPHMEGQPKANRPIKRKKLVKPSFLGKTANSDEPFDKEDGKKMAEEVEEYLKKLFKEKNGKQ
jgi:hypothetical protein